MSRHAAFIRDLIRQGKILAAGPVDDPAGAWGFGLAAAPHAAEAVRWGAADPVVQADLGLQWEVYPILSLLQPEA